MISTIIKRDGTQEPFDASKPIGHGEWAALGLPNSSRFPAVVVKTVAQMPRICTSEDFQKQLIRNFILEDSWSSNISAGRLYASLTHKQLYGDTIPTVQQVQKNLMDVGYMIALDYSDEEYAIIETFIDHERDFTYPHFQLDQLRKKYALRDRLNRKREFESAQFIYMRMAMALAVDRPRDRRLTDVREFYDRFSLNKLNPPTPNYVNLGTKHNGYASCCLYTTLDEIRSIHAGDVIAYTMTYMSAGIGSHINTRSIGDPVRGGLFPHEGKLPYYRAKLAAVRANKQNGRNGAANTFYSVFDPEFQSISRLKNPMTPEDRRIRGMDYTGMSNKFFANKVAKNEKVFLFNSFTAPDLYELLFNGDVKKFASLYEKYEADESFKKTYLPAREMLLVLLNEAYETGRNYEAWIDEINRHTPFKDPIHSSNLCVEICEPTRGYEHVQDLYTPHEIGYCKVLLKGDSPEQVHTFTVNHALKKKTDNTYCTGLDLEEGQEYYLNGNGLVQVDKVLEKKMEPEVALCSIGAAIITNIDSDEDYFKTMYYGYLMIDRCIHMADYELPHVGYTAKQRMSAGMGIMDLAHWMARKNLKYSSQEGKDEIHRVAERHMYFAIEASLALSKELGVAPWMHRTKWVDGWLPIDTYNRAVDKITSEPLHYDWEDLRARVVENGGIRNSVLVAYMPGESSSKGAGVCNSIYPIRELTLLKSDNGNVIYWAAPEGDTLGQQYESAWDIKTSDLFDDYAIIQKFTDHSISADEYRKLGPGELVGSSEMIRNYLDMTQKGIKTRYYLNSHTSKETKLLDGTTVISSHQNVNEGANCGSGGCAL